MSYSIRTARSVPIARAVRTAHPIRHVHPARLVCLTTCRSMHSASVLRNFSQQIQLVRPVVYLPVAHGSVIHSRSHTSGSSAAAASTTSMEGACLCKAIQLKVTDDNLFGEQRRGHLCHCSNCRKVAGGLFGTNLVIEEEKVEWVRGRDIVKIYEDRDTLSGKPVYRHFCPDCGVPIMSIAESIKGKVILKLGIYPKLPVPEWESFAAERQAWEKPFEGCVQFKTKSHGEKMEGSL